MGRKDDFLGMSYQTASAQLRKKMLFRLLQKYDEDNCFVCGEKIAHIEQLSIEHKEPWLDRENGVEKFWDLDNIAFSHHACNRPHNHVSFRTKKEPDAEGRWQCYSCEEYKHEDQFYKNNARFNGITNECKDCKRARVRT